MAFRTAIKHRDDTMTIEEKQDEIIEEFTELDDWMDRYQLLIDMGSGMEPLAEEKKTEQNLIDGCQSRVWLHASKSDDGTLHFEADSDALIVKGIISLLIGILDGQTPQDILDADARAQAIDGCRRVADAVYAGLDASDEVEAVLRLGIGDTALVRDASAALCPKNPAPLI